MVLFDDTFADIGFPLLQEQNGQSAVYTTGKSVQSSVTILVGNELPGDERSDEFPMREMWMPIASITPRAGEKITVLSNDWIITDVEAKSATVAKLTTRLIR